MSLFSTCITLIVGGGGDGRGGEVYVEYCISEMLCAVQDYFYLVFHHVEHSSSALILSRNQIVRYNEFLDRQLCRVDDILHGRVNARFEVGRPVKMTN